MWYSEPTIATQPRGGHLHIFLSRWAGMRVLDTHAMAKTGIATPLGRAILEHKHTKIGDNFNQLGKFLALALAPPQTTAVDAPHAPAMVAKEHCGLAVAGVRRASICVAVYAHAGRHMPIYAHTCTANRHVQRNCVCACVGSIY